MNGDEGAAGALAAAVVEALSAVPGLSQVSDGVPLQAGDAAAAVEAGPETDWGHKSGAGAELRFAVLVTCGGERPARARRLLQEVRVALTAMPPKLNGWRLVSLVPLRARVVPGAGRDRGRSWTAVADYRARMLAE